MVVPRNLNCSSVATVLFIMLSWGSAGGFLLKSFEHVQLQVIVTAPDSQLFKLVLETNVHFVINV